MSVRNALDFLLTPMFFLCILFAALGLSCVQVSSYLDFCLALAILAVLTLVCCARRLSSRALLGYVPPKGTSTSGSKRPSVPSRGVHPVLLAVLWFCLSVRIGEARKPGPDWTVSVANLSGLNTRAFWLY